MNQRRRILDMLKEAPGNKVTNEQLNKVCYRYGARLHELREEGHAIVSEQLSKGLWQFTYEGQGKAA